jgi:ectoine hydroxylase-related dioxygenase (phytanoyl-CoA dioxygenase family)
MRDQRGYAICHAVIERGETAQLLEAICGAGSARTRAGARHLLNVPAVRAIAEDRRLQQLAAQFLGQEPVPFRATLFDKSSSSNWLVTWHQDTVLPVRRRSDDPAWGPWSTKAGVLCARAPAWALERVVALRISLDDSTSTNGPLRVLPDTHRLGVLSDAEIAHLATTIPAVDCLAAAGSVVAMRPLTVHASSKAIDEQPRRVLHIEYASSLAITEGLELTVC